MIKKRYKLLKELPDAAVGTIFVGDGEDSGYSYSDTFGRDQSWTWKNVVECRPEWFEELPLSQEYIDEEFNEITDRYNRELSKLNEWYKKQINYISNYLKQTK